MDRKGASTHRLISMEEDIHGRMFETFLDATIRGRELGQFFTPRDIVNLMVQLADLRVSKAEVSTVLDACCGSGGFLIAAMARMTNLVRSMVGLTDQEREQLTDEIRNTALYGIDAGSDPAIYRIARMNMYLHGDGGSHIYHADALDKNVGEVGKHSIESGKYLTELRDILVVKNKRFDVILSNPPFSLKYSRDDEGQLDIMNQYSVGIHSGQAPGGLLSSVMFLERYRELVADEGQILAIVDESVLSGQSYAVVRNYIREHFIIVGIISLPGDAFRRASARVKTSVLILRLRNPGEEQSDAFVAAAVYLGLEEKVARRIGADASDLEAAKAAEIARIVEDFRKYRSGVDGPYAVPAARLSDRLDVKFCIGDRGRKAGFWTSGGLDVVEIGSVLTPVPGRVIKVSGDEGYQFLRVNYGGDVVDGEYIEGEDCSYSTLYIVHAWDILLSNMGVGRGAVGIVPPFHANKYVSNEYTIAVAASKEEAVYYTNLLRSKEILGDILASTTGMNRGRIKWDNIATVQVPAYEGGNEHIEKVVEDLEGFWAAYSQFTQSRASHVDQVVSDLQIDGADARLRWLAFKPPE